MGNSNPSADAENAFMKGISKRKGNSQTDGKILLLFGNKIAEHRDDGVYITNCGYQTPTTKAHLNLLPNVSIHQAKKVWYLNNEQWDGGWIKINDAIVKQSGKVKPIFDTTTRYIRTDGWRGYSEPIYAIVGANDTGMYEDSPCRTDTCLMELGWAKRAIGDIPSKFIVCESSNVFCIHRYLVVPPSYIDAARKRINAWWEDKGNKETTLLYEVKHK